VCIPISYGATTPSGPGPLIIEASRPHSDTQRSEGILWTSDQPDAQTSIWQQRTLTGDISITTGGNQTRNPNKLAASDPRLWHMLFVEHINCNKIILYCYTEAVATTNQKQLRQLLNFLKGSRILTLFSGIKLGQQTLLRFWDKRIITVSLRLQVATVRVWDTKVTPKFRRNAFPLFSELNFVLIYVESSEKTSPTISHRENRGQ